MKRRIVWSKDAGDEIAGIVSWYKDNAGKSAAGKIYAKISSRVRMLKDMPEIGKEVQLLKDMGISGYRQIVQDHWIIYYRIGKESIHIISVVDGRRDLEEILYGKIMDGRIG
jgi:toxin ParE1/3/4